MVPRLRSPRPWWLATLLAGLTILATTAGHAQQKCAKDADCPDGATCADGTCSSGADEAEPAEGDKGADEGKQEVPISDRARERFKRGVELLQAEGEVDYAKAYEQFKKAYEDSPSPKILSNLGVCAMHLERDGEAIEAMERYLAEVEDIPPEERAGLQRFLHELNGRGAKLELTIEPDGAFVVDERVPDEGDPVINEYGPVKGTLELGIRAGSHRINIKRKGYEPEEWEFEIAPGEMQQRKIELVKPPPPPPPPKPKPKPKPPPPPPEEPSMTHVWVMVGVTAALGVGAGVVGGLALERKGAYEDYQRGGPRTEAEQVRDQGEIMNITTDILLGATVISAGVTVVLLFTSGPDEPEQAAAVSVAPCVGPGTGGLTVSGAF